MNLTTGKMPGHNKNPSFLKAMVKAKHDTLERDEKLMDKMNQLSKLNASRFIRKDSSDDDGPLVAPPSCQPYTLKYRNGLIF